MDPGLRYEHEIIEVLKSHLSVDASCIDAGAHEGAVLRHMRALAPKARHYAFEPLPHLASELKREFPDVAVHDCALGNATGDYPYFFVKNASAYSGLRKRSYDIPNPDIESIRVRVRRLDDMVAPEDMISLVKIDVEGGEYDVMLGGLGVLKRCMPVVVFEAGEKSSGHYGVSPEMIYDLVRLRIGLHLSTMARWLAGEPGFSKADFLQSYRSEFYFIAYPAARTQSSPT